MAETKNPTAPGKASVRSEMASLAGSYLDLTTLPVAINRLRARFGWSRSHAMLVASLAGIGPREAHS